MAIDLGDIPTGTPPTAGEKLQIRSAIGVGTTDAPTFLAQTLTGQSLTGTQATSLVDLSATWNTTGTPSALKLNVTDTASNAASKLMDLQVGGVSKANILKNGLIYGSAQITCPIGFTVSSSLDSSNQTASFTAQSLTLPSGAAIGFTNVTSGFGSLDTMLFRDGAPGILAQRNGVNAQAFRVYNTYTDANNYERGVFAWTSNQLQITTEAAGTGVANRSMAITAAGQMQIRSGVGWPISFEAAGGARWSISSSGHFLAALDNTYDIGASGANRPKNIYAGTSMSSPSFVSSGSLSAFGSNTQVAGTLHVGYTGSASASLYAPSNGVLLIGNVTASDFGRLCLGGTTSAFPAIARSGANIGIVLGDGSGYTSLLCKNAVQNPGVGTTVTPASIGDLVTETTSNTSVTLKLKGSDGTVRSVALTLA